MTGTCRCVFNVVTGFILRKYVVMAMSELTIGVLGGMGTYATIYAFKQYAEIFYAVKEWERPSIILSN